MSQSGNPTGEAFVNDQEIVNVFQRNREHYVLTADDVSKKLNRRIKKQAARKRLEKLAEQPDRNIERRKVGRTYVYYLESDKEKVLNPDGGTQFGAVRGIKPFWKDWRNLKVNALGLLSFAVPERMVWLLTFVFGLVGFTAGALAFSVIYSLPTIEVVSYLVITYILLIIALIIAWHLPITGHLLRRLDGYIVSKTFAVADLNEMERND